MNEQPSPRSRCPEAIRLLTFTVMGVRMGVDAEQVAAMMGVDGAHERGQAMFHLHEKISFGKTPIAYRAPKALLIDDGNSTFIVVIDNPHDISAVPVQSIHPLPAVIAAQRGARAFWGAMADDGGIVLLVDFTRIGPG